MARWLLDCRPLCGHAWRLGLATEPQELEEVYRLRYDVFFRELGYGSPAIKGNTGHDVDSFDEWCDHLILYDMEKKRMIGTYRAIPGAEAIRRGGFYGAFEFDLTPLAPIFSRILQGSRTCIAADYRGGLAFQYLSYGMDRLLRERNCRYFMGADSFSTSSPDTLNQIYSYVKRFATDSRWQIEPTPDCRVKGVREVPVSQEYERMLPTVIRMDFRLGFRAISPIAWDPEFCSYDILVLADRDHVSDFYRSVIERIDRQFVRTTDSSAGARRTFARRCKSERGPGNLNADAFAEPSVQYLSRTLGANSMNRAYSLCRAGIVVVVAAAGLLTVQSGRALRGAEPPKKLPTAWRLDEALQQLAFHPGDAYLQYVALQLGKRDGREPEVLQRIERPGPFGNGQGRRSRADLFNTFSGALALQESLQLDTMRGERRNRPNPGAPLPDKVAVASLAGPAVKSHPWEKMLGDRRPVVSMLSQCVPEDFWFAEFRSLPKLNEITALGQAWGGHILTQSARRRQIASNR